MQRDPINEITKRTERYWYEDGLWEISFGLVYAGLAVFYWITKSFNLSGPLSLILPFFQIFVMLAIFWLASKLVKYLKEHITYPRTGYVAYRKPAPRSRTRRIFLTGLISAVLAAVIGIMASFSTLQNQMPLIISLPMAGALAFLGYRFGLARMYIIAALMVASGYVVSMLSLREDAVIALYFGVLAALLIISGLITLMIYLNRTRPASISEDL